MSFIEISLAFSAFLDRSLSCYTKYNSNRNLTVPIAGTFTRRKKKEEKTIRRFHFAIIYGTFVLGLMIEQKAHKNNRKINKLVIVIILFIQKFVEFIILCYIYLNLYCRWWSVLQWKYCTLDQLPRWKTLCRNSWVLRIRASPKG